MDLNELAEELVKEISPYDGKLVKWIPGAPHNAYETFEIEGAPGWYIGVNETYDGEGVEWCLGTDDTEWDCAGHLTDDVIKRWLNEAEYEQKAPQAAQEAPTGPTKEEIVDELYGLHKKPFGMFGPSKDPARSNELKKLLEDMGEPLPRFLKESPGVLAWLRGNCKFAGGGIG